MAASSRIPCAVNSSHPEVLLDRLEEIRASGHKALVSSLLPSDASLLNSLDLKTIESLFL
jgi:anti-anti-sigma regulatory factor